MRKSYFDLLKDAAITGSGGGGGTPPVLIEKSVTENGTYTASDDSADGYSKVVVDVEPDLITKSITANGTYTALEDEADGYSAVTVDVPPTVGFNKVISYAWANINESIMYGIIILRSQNGIYDLKNFQSLGNRTVLIIAVDPLTKMLFTSNVGTDKIIVTFTPAEDYDGFYMNGFTKYSPSGSTVTNGDGKSYGFRTTFGSSSSGIQAFNTGWSFDMS